MIMLLFGYSKRSTAFLRFVLFFFRVRFFFEPNQSFHYVHRFKELVSIVKMTADFLTSRKLLTLSMELRWFKFLLLSHRDTVSDSEPKSKIFKA